MRRLLILASLVVFVDTMFFAAIVPLLPGLSDEFGLSKTDCRVALRLVCGGHARRRDSGGVPGRARRRQADDSSRARR